VAREDPPAPTGAVADHAQGLVDRDHVGTALDALPARQRQVLVLRFVEDLDVATTARLLRVREGTVKSTTHAALAALRADLTDSTRTTEVTR
jgi:RNA polymerase sigma factor (sigma-70 family)